MALYSDNINTFLYKYSKPIYITETSGADRDLIPIRLDLNSQNFNFDLARSDGMDIRVAELQNGSGVFHMWIAYWNQTDSKATVWFKLPKLLADEVKEVWIFWGFSGDSGISDLSSLTDYDPVFLFADDFNGFTVDSFKWETVVGNYEMYDSSIYLSQDSRISSISCLGGEVATYDDNLQKVTASGGLFGNHQTTANCYLSYTGSLSYTAPLLIDGNVTSYDIYYYVSRFGGCAIGIDLGEVKTNIRKVRFYLYNYPENYNDDIEWKIPGAYDTSVILYKTNTNLAGEQSFIYGYNAYELQSDSPIIKYQDYVWYFDIEFDAPGQEFRYLHMYGYIEFVTTISYYFSEIEVYTDTSSFVINPSNFVLEEGIVGVESPTDTTTYYAHRVQCLGGENALDIRYFWEGSVDRKHNFDTGTLQTYAGNQRGLEIGSYAQLYFSYNEDRDRVYQGMKNRNSYIDYEDNWERTVHRNTEPNTFILWGHDASTSNGVGIEWVVAREYDPDIEPIIDLSNIYEAYEYVAHQPLDYNEYSSDITSTDFYHSSDMGGNPYNMSDNTAVDLLGAFVSDSGVTQGSILIDFGRPNSPENSRNYLHYDNGHVDFFNAAKLSDLNSDIYGNTYWATTTTSGWASIKFPRRIAVASFSIWAVPSNLTGMAKNYNFYGSNKDPRFSGWSEKVLLTSGTFLQTANEQVVYLRNTSNYFYYILEVIDTYGANIAIQEWAMYRRTPSLGKKVVSQLRLKPVVDNVNEYYFPKQIKLEGSNDLINWTTLLNIIDTPTPFTDYAYGRWSRYSFNNYESFYLYRLTCYDNWRAGEDIIKISEWEMVERVEEATVYRILGGSTSNINSIWADESTTYDSGHFYIVNDALTTVKVNELVEVVTISGTTSDINIKGS